MSRKEKDTRVCRACGCEKNKSELIRITRDYKDGKYKINQNNEFQGRSLYVCKNEKCIKFAVKKGRIAKENGDFLLENYSKKYSIPDWISYSVYPSFPNGNVSELENEENKLSAGDFVVFISNELTHEYFLFKGLTAQLWDVLTSSIFDKEIEEFVNKNDLNSEFSEFINGLIDLKLLTLTLQKGKELYLPVSSDETLKKERDELLTTFVNYLYERKLLPELFIEMTYKCNLKCIHCYNDKSLINDTLSFKECKKYIDGAKSAGAYCVTLSGGECTLNKDFLKVAKYIRSKRMSLKIYTNGQTLYDNKQLYKEVLELYPQEIGISLYSLKPEIHDEITGVKGSHNKTINVIKKLRADNVNVQIKCFQLKQNADEYREIAEFAKEVNASVNFDNNIFITDENKKFVASEEVLLKCFKDDNSFAGVKNRKKNDINEKFLNEKICAIGKNSLCIHPDGVIYPCVEVGIPLGGGDFGRFVNRKNLV